MRFLLLESVDDVVQDAGLTRDKIAEFKHATPEEQDLILKEVVNKLGNPDGRYDAFFPCFKRAVSNYTIDPKQNPFLSLIPQVIETVGPEPKYIPYINTLIDLTWNRTIKKERVEELANG